MVRGLAHRLLIGSDVEYHRYTCNQFLKYQCGGDERGVTAESCALVTPANRELLARRVMLFDRYIWPIDNADQRDFAQALDVIDRIAAKGSPW